MARRKVNKDRSITFNGRLFESPVALIGKRVELLYHDTQPQQVEVKFQNKSFGMLVPVNLNVNCRIKRDKNNNLQILSNTQLNEYGGGKLWSSIRRADDEQNLVRFAHNWNYGMLEYWNNGYTTLHHLEKFGDSWDKQRHGSQKYQ